MHGFARMAAAAAALAAAAPAAAAGIHTDALSKCLVAKSDSEDRMLLTQWIFGAMSTHPAVKGIGEASAAKRKELAGKAADLFERLMMEDCRAETVEAIRYDGVGAIETGFGVLGEVAMVDLMAHPDVARELDAMASQLDNQRMEALTRDSGRPAPKPGTR